MSICLHAVDIVGGGMVGDVSHGVAVPHAKLKHQPPLRVLIAVLSRHSMLVMEPALYLFGFFYE